MQTVSEIKDLLQHTNRQEFKALERSLAADSRKGVVAAVKVARKRLDKEEAEEKRLASLFAFDTAQLPDEGGYVVGLDEVGRGAVAGPLAVGAVMFPSGCMIAGLNDSKQLSPHQRETIAAEIEEKALAYTVFYVQPEFIDQNGMSASLRKAFSSALSAVEQQGHKAAVVLLDGNPLGIDAREVNVIKGDSKSASIAAASVIAKVKRDALMTQLSGSYPEYGFFHNKGYASQDHIEAIQRIGLSPVHRQSFCHSFMQASLF